MVIMGLKRGVSDYFLAYPVNPFHGLWLELKRTGRRSRVSAEQLMWQERTRKVGYMSVTAYGWEQAKEFIEEYLRGQDGL